MSNFPSPFQATRPAWQTDADAGVVHRFMNAVYAWMCVGLATTAVVAWYVSTQPELMKKISGPVIFPLIIVELAMVFVIASAVNKIGANLATLLFVIYAALNGLTLSFIFYIYKMPAIGGAFVVTAGMFGITSVYGMFTKRDLTSWGSFLFMGLIGLILASIVNIFWANSTLYWIVTYAGVIIFIGLTAYDTQKLKLMSYQLEGNAALAARMAIVGSLILYLDFINLFLYMLRILGDRRR